MNRNIEDILNNLSREVGAVYILKKAERARIFSHIIEHGHAAEPLPSPYHVVSFPHILFMNTASMALFAVFLFTGVMSYAAEGALPGDTLYVVKTQFNENLQSLLTFSPESKAKLEASLAEKRLIEAQKLAVDDRLSEDSEKQIEESFQKHSGEFKKSVQEIQEKQPDAALTLSSNFQSTLSAHENVLKTVTSSSTSVASTSSVTNTVTAEIGTFDSIRKEAEEGVAVLPGQEIKDLAALKLNLVTVASQNLSVVATSSAVSSSIQSHITSALDIASKGAYSYSIGAYLEAYGYAQTALRELKEVEVTLSNTNSLGLSRADEKKIFDTLSLVEKATSTNASTTPVIGIGPTTGTSTPPATTTLPVQ